LIENSADLCRTLRLASLLGSVVLCLGSTSAVQAQTLNPPQLFLRWPGITGSSTAPGHAGDIPLASYTQTSSHNNGGIPTCGAVTVTKFIDSASPTFLGLVFTHRVTPSATIMFTDSNFIPFYTVELDNVYVTSITQSDPISSDAITTETVVFSASQFRFKSTTGTGSMAFGWNCMTNKAL
jgi:type VI protein secretion system component Hcp